MMTTKRWRYVVGGNGIYLELDGIEGNYAAAIYSDRTFAYIDQATNKVVNDKLPPEVSNEDAKVYVETVWRLS